MQILISGVAGQDGSYLAESMLAQPPDSPDGSPVHIAGVIHPGEPLSPLLTSMQRAGLELLPCELADSLSWRHLLRESRPARVYHLAALSSPAACSADPRLSRLVNVSSAEVLLDWQARDSPRSRVLICSSSAIFGRPLQSPQNESTPAAPTDEYGRQKLQLREMAAAAREKGHFVACPILFNHESPRRSEDFVIAKICRSAARISLGQQDGLRLGDTSARRDWGWAPEYAQGIRWLLELEEPLEAVLATGESHSVAEAVNLAFHYVGLDPQGLLAIDPSLHRPEDFAASQGDSTRAFEEFGWQARTRFAQIIPLLIDAALAEYRS